MSRELYSHSGDHTSTHRLPSLHEVLGDVLDQPSRPSSSASCHTSSEGRRSVSAAMRYSGNPHLMSFSGQHPPQSKSHGGSDLAPMSHRSQHSRNLSPSSPSPYSSSSTSYPEPSGPPGHSFHLFNYSPNQGLVHQRSSERDDLDPTIPKPRLPPSDPARKYVCAECGNRFSKQSTLRNHLLTHTGERPFPCTYPGCGRRFSMACNMQRHMRTHTNASAFHIDDDDYDWGTQVTSRGGSTRGGSASREGSRSRGGSPREELWLNDTKPRRSSSGNY